MNSELRTRTISAVILGAAALFITWWSAASFAVMCALGGVILLKEWWGLTKHRSWWSMALGVLYIGAGVAALICLRYLGIKTIFCLFALVWMADIAGYLVGKRFGKHKIAPTISPGKSWEGLAGSIVACALLGGAYAVTQFSATPQNISTVLFCGVFAGSYAVIGLLGDLFESALKRHAGVKDSGRLIPGHGGLFDRVDALISCAIFMALFFIILKVLDSYAV